MKISKYNIIKNYKGNILIYNSFSKASIILEKGSSTKAFEDINEFNKLTDNEKELLINNGFVVNEERDELGELKYIYEQKYFETDKLNIVLVPSLLCNFKCPYCCEKDYLCGEENVERYFQVLKKYAKNNFKNYNLVQISFFGGEPLIYSKECLKFLDWLKKDSEKNQYGYFTTIVTNGSLLTESILDKLLKHNLRALQITIDSDKQNHNQLRVFKDGRPSFDLLINKINQMAEKIQKNNDLKFIVRINLNNTTVAKVKETLLLINEENRQNIHLLIRAIYNTHAYEECNENSVDKLEGYFSLGEELGFQVLKEKFKFQTCEACGDRKFFYLMPDLSMWKCINDLGYAKGKFGFMDQDGSVQIVPNNTLNWYKHCTSVFNDKECLECKLLPDCLGGCPLHKAKKGEKQCRPFDMICLPHVY